VTRLRRILSDLLNWLNGLGSVVLAYALLNPSAGSDLINLLPDKLKTPVALMIPALWFGVVQYAKVKAIKKDGAP
jgi:hypothetical protein